jgi:hypothetical protein
MGYIKKERSTLCETCGETDKVKLLNYKPICYSCVDAKKVKSFRSVECETCGETNKNELLAFKPICHKCYNKKYRKPKPVKTPKIFVIVPKNVGDPKEFRKKEYARLYHQLSKNDNKDAKRHGRSLYKRIQTLKKYCIKLNKDVNDYLTNDITLEDVIRYNESLKIQLSSLKMVKQKKVNKKRSTGRKIKNNIRNRIRKALRRKYETKLTTSTEEILGCRIEYFKNYLECKFEPWMNWDNYGLYNGEFKYGWDIDHITPLNDAKTIEVIYQLNHYKNLQPLCSKVNRDIKKHHLKF